MDQVDFGEPLDVGCGRLLPVRSSEHAAIYHYRYDPSGSPRCVDDKQFVFNSLVVTTKGRWNFYGADGGAEIDHASMALGVADDSYGCRHHPDGDSNFIVTLGHRALDPDYGPLFANQVIPAYAAAQVIERAIRVEGNDPFDSIIFSLFDDAALLSTKRSGIRPANVRVQRAKRFIEFHAFEKLSLDDVAAEIGLTPFTALRQFRAATGTTPYAYLLQIRLEQAKRLLDQTRDSVQCIAKRVGFDSLAHFSRFFKIHTGYAPSLYRDGREATNAET